MAKRKAYAPFSLTSEAGVAQTPVEGYIDVEQKIYPTVNTGTVNENGTWAGVKASDDQFIGISKAEAIADDGTVLFPDTNDFPSIDMTGFTGIFLAFRPTNGGGSGFEVSSVMGPDTIPFANLSPVDPNALIRSNNSQATPDDWENVFSESGQLMTADVWNIFAIKNILADWRNLQFRVVNRTGVIVDLEFGFMRLL